MEILKMSLCICLLFEMNYVTKSETNIFNSQMIFKQNTKIQYTLNFVTKNNKISIV